MKKIICYGDSNTFGYNPKDGSRYPYNARWSAILKENLIKHFEVIEQGLNNRCGFVENSRQKEYCALKHFPEFFKKIDDIEIVILAVGTNDLQFRYNLGDMALEEGLKYLIKLIKNKNSKVIIVPPVVLNENILKSYFSSLFNENSILKSKTISKIYQKIANDFNCYYFDFNEFALPSDVDGLHYSEKSHKIIAQKLTSFIKNKIEAKT